MKRPGRLLLATTSAGKLRELRGLLDGEGLPLGATGLGELPPQPPVIEDGETFLDNARKKAWALASVLGEPALADDSGLCVDALDGAPGVHSARWVEGSDDDRNRALLARLATVPEGARSARFVCALALALPDGRTIEVEASSPGRIAMEPGGSGGFGYDPLFLGADGRRFSELTPPEKAAVSHRGRAFVLLLPHLWALAEELHVRLAERTPSE